MNKIHELEIIEPEVEIEKKKDVRILYIEADEDHVSLQNKGTEDKDGKRTQKITVPKLIYIHEGYDLKKSSKKRKILKDLQF